MTNASARLFIVVAAMAALAVMCFTPTMVQAQSAGMRVNIPFDFYVGSQRFPAGPYTVLHQTDPAVVHISDGNGHVSMTLSSGFQRWTRNRAVSSNCDSSGV